MDSAKTPTRRLVVIPMRGLRNGKTRLRAAFPGDWVNGLVWALAQMVIAAVVQADPVSAVALLSPDPELLRLVAEIYPRIITLRQPNNGLNEGLDFALDFAQREMDVQAFYTVNADIPLISSAAVRELYHETEWRSNSCAVIAHDHYETGVNALGLYMAPDFQFHFGPNSRMLHTQEAHMRNMQSISLRYDAFIHDIDTIEDVIWLQTRHAHVWRDMQRQIAHF